MEDQYKAAELHCRINRNGNGAEDFKVAGKILRDTARDAHTNVVQSLQPMLHGRNYQHLSGMEAHEARQADVDRMIVILDALKTLGDFGLHLGLMALREAETSKN
jgi:hypothetical protein